MPNSTAKGIEPRVLVGTAGWSYKDWEGTVYPPHGSKFDHLAYLSHYFDLIEVNSSFYRIPPPTHARSWVRRVAGNDDFLFTVKLFRGFTHAREELKADDAEAFRKFLDPLADAGRLGALLIQYPWSFKEAEGRVDELFEVVKTFRDYPLAVEVRHASLQNEEFLGRLREESVAFVNIDQPLFSDSVKPSAIETSPLAYFRFHGRNYEKWFAHEESWERYNYLYSASELEPWIEKINRLEKAEKVFVVTNNHFRGQAAVNAVEIKRRLGQPAEAPPQLAETYPERL
jgi:uncharacterized protein YecE (DUF72 family)